METKIILETERLILREFNTRDAEFIFTLLNTPAWIEFIGDKNVKSLQDAKSYIKKSLIKSYKDNDFGLWLVIQKDSNIPIGMCGLVNRPTLKDVDIGFALLPEFLNLGFGYEAASATLNYANNVLNIDKIVAITMSKNNASIKLLEKLGLVFEKEITLSKDDKVLLYSPSGTGKK